MFDLNAICAAIKPVDHAVARATQDKLDFKTKPRRSLGRLEDLACRYAAIIGNTQPPMPVKAVVVMGADHGVAEEGVSAYPQEVTAQMLLNFARGGAAINVLAKQANARVEVVDIGVKAPVIDPAIRSARVAPGTQCFTRGPAMTTAQTLAAIEVGVKLAHELIAQGVNVIGIGEMGIGNTTTASALSAALTGASVEDVTGNGTGIADDIKLKKKDVIRRALALHQPDPKQPLDILTRLGGLEIAGLVGVVLGAASQRCVVIVDGFISSTAALIAARIAPLAQGYLMASHKSVEPGHRHVLNALDIDALFDLNMRLGEGTGAALAMMLLDASVAVLRDMATFETAGVTDAGA